MYKNINKILKTILFPVIILVTLLCFHVNTVKAAGWYDPSWTYRNQITIDRTKVGTGTEDETSFPVEISLTGLSNINATGTDIRFTASDGTTLLPREIESYSSGNLIAWVQVPTLSHTTSTAIYVYYGNSSATEPIASSTYGSQSVWSNGYAGVWHLGNSSLPLNMNDSTSNANNGTNHSATATSGQIGGAAAANGTSGYISLGGVSGIQNNKTFSSWVKMNSTPAAGKYPNYISVQGTGYYGTGLLAPLGADYGGNAGKYVFQFGSSSTNYQLNSATLFSSNFGNWVYVNGTYDGTTAKIYVNNSLDNSLSAPSHTSNAPSGYSVILGSFGQSNGQYGTYGTLDGAVNEVRVSSVARSAGWISTEYYNQSSPSTFYSVAAQENVNLPGAPTAVSAVWGSTTATVSFTAPAYSGTSAITGYTVTSSPDNITATGTSSPITVNGLTSGTSYTFTVTATNSGYTGPASSASNVVIPGAPYAPTIGTATAGNGQATVTFTAPSNDGGSTITGYTVTSSPGNFTGTSTASPITVNGLTNGVSYTFTVTATNAIHTGPASAPSNSAIPATVPDAPTIGTATATNAQVSVSFTPPGNNGGSTITGYTVTSSPGNITVTGTTSPIIVTTGLANGNYTFTVTATNIMGTGSPSSASNVVLSANRPYTDEINLTSSSGNSPYGSLILWTDGNLYGMTVNGGVNNAGVIFKYNPNTNTYTDKIDLSVATGAYPQGSLTLGADGNFYGMTAGGGANGVGVIFEYNPNTNTYTDKVDLTSTTGSSPHGSLTLGADNNLYGMTYNGGVNNAGVIFQYNPSTVTYTDEIDLASITGAYPQGSLTLGADNNLYGMTSSGGVNNTGVIFEYDPSTNVYTDKVNLSSSTGNSPYGSLTLWTDGNLYGATVNGGLNNDGVIFEYNPNTNIYTDKIDLSIATGSDPHGSLTGSDGNLYGMTTNGGANSDGVIFEYNPNTNIYTDKINLSSTTGAYPQGSLTLGGDNNLYGMMPNGGANGGIWNSVGTVLFASIPNDSLNVYEPTLIREGGCLLVNTATCWKMWFQSGSSSPNVYYAESPDGINWTRYATPVLRGHVSGSVIKNGSTYYFYYANSARTQFDEYTSSNGRDLTLANAGVIVAGGSSWDSRLVSNTGGVVVGGTLYLFAEGIGSGNWATGLFTSTDFHTFTPYSGNPVISSSGARGGPAVPYFDGSNWWMWVHGATGAGLPTDMYRYFAPALTGPWTASPSGSVLPRQTQDEGVGINIGQVADPYIMEVDGKTYLYYTADHDGTQASGMQHIKLAIADMPISSVVGTSEGRSDGVIFQYQSALSLDSTLKNYSTIKGVAVTNLGTSSPVLSSVIAGAVTISDTAASDTSNTGSYITSFIPANGGATVTRVVKYATGQSTTSFATDTVYNNEPITNQDFFVVEVTSAGSSAMYHKIIVTVTSTADQITSFILTSPSVIGSINNTNQTVAITVPYGTNVTNLIPTITLSTGDTISPTSGTTENFTSPQQYTVFAQNGATQQTYTVTVTVAGPIISSGGGGGGIIYNTPVGTQGQAIDFSIIKQTGKVVILSLNADPSTVKGYLISTKPDFSDAQSIQPFTSTSTFQLPDTNAHTIYLKYYSTTGTWSPIISHNEVVTTMATNSITPTPSTATFSRTLKLGSTNTEVKALQKFLNTHGFIITRSGAGSPGHETTTFGAKTVLALKKFQEAHAKEILTPSGLTRGTGIFGKATMTFVNSMNQ